VTQAAAVIKPYGSRHLGYTITMTYDFILAAQNSAAYQIPIVIVGIILAIITVKCLNKYYSTQQVTWNAIAVKNQFKVSTSQDFTKQEHTILSNSLFGTVGPHTIFTVGHLQDDGDLEVEALQLARKSQGAKTFTYFRYHSAHGNSSIKNYGMALIIDPGVADLKPFKWKLGRSLKTEHTTDAPNLDSIDWTKLRGHVDGGWLVGIESTESGLIIWMTAPRAESSQQVIDLQAEVVGLIAPSPCFT
jgi:hypothetical protein